MKRNLTLAAAAMVIAAAVLLSYLAGSARPGYRPQLALIGDVENPLSFTELGDVEGARPEDGAVNLGALIELAGPWETSYDVLLVGSDGLVARIDDRLQDTSLSFSTENGWEIRDALHPVSSQVKHLQEIVVVARTDASLRSIGIDGADGPGRRFTPGSLLAQGLRERYIWQGQSSIEREEGEFDVTVFTTRRMLDIGETLAQADNFCVVGRDGSRHLLAGGGALSVDGNRIGFEGAEMRIPDIAGILLDPPGASIADAYHDALYYVRKDVPVMLVFLDGFSLAQFEHAQATGDAPYLSALAAPRPAMSFYKPVTNVGFSALISGLGPDMSGVHSRADRTPSHSIFTVLAEEGREGLLLEGDVRILDVDAETVLHVDANDNGSSDDEIFASALAAVRDKETDYLLVHFHGIDDAGHSHGPLGAETIRQIRLHDEWTRQLADAFDGKVIIISDHGMHETDEGGTHGQVRWDDMVVPYWLIDGGGQK